MFDVEVLVLFKYIRGEPTKSGWYPSNVCIANIIGVAYAGIVRKFSDFSHLSGRSRLIEISGGLFAEFLLVPVTLTLFVADLADSTFSHGVYCCW